MLRYMLDTDICSYILKRSSVSVLNKLQTVPIAEVCISAITKAELLYGVELSSSSPRRQIAVDAFLRHVDVLDFPAEAALNYAKIRADLKLCGNLIGANDLWIAAHAQYLDLVLVTNNTREFSRIQGLRLENWT